MHVGILGCGRWATFLAWYTVRLGYRATVWGRAGSAKLEALRRNRTNDTICVPDTVALTDRPSDLADCELYLVGVAAQSLRTVLSQWADDIPEGRTVILCMKGLETDTGLRLSQVAQQCLGRNRPVAVWLGPGHPQDFANGIPSCMVIDALQESVKQELVSVFSSELIRLYYGSDLIGNEIGAAAKNVVGITAGLLDGAGHGSLKGALMARGAYEISRLILALGGQEISAYGLCHLGDYEATLFSPYSHNRQFGECTIQKKPYGMLAEGYNTVPALIALARAFDVELPICQAVYEVLYEDRDPLEALSALMTRKLKAEF
jgi:glycerol-3-phosphate dehydrogenase (NAD(P)+)